jgi:hypothetical protein
MFAMDEDDDSKNEQVKRSGHARLKVDLQTTSSNGYALN